MDIITTITQYPNQQFTLVLENNETALMRLYYNSRMESWYFDLTYNDLTINGVKVVLHPNILRQFRNIIPFGLSILSESFVEPFEIECFSSARVEIGILNKEEVEEIEAEVYYNE